MSEQYKNKVTKNMADNEILESALQPEEQEINCSFDSSVLFKPWITPVNQGRRIELMEQAKETVTISDFEKVGRSFSSCVHVLSSKSEIRILKEGYYSAKCVDVNELSDGQTLVLTFEPSDIDGQRYSGICLTLPKVIGTSDALGEFLFGMGLETEAANSDTALVIKDVEEFKELVLGKSFGIEVSVNVETGWMYITDFFNPNDTEWPTCPEEIVRNVD